MMNLLNKTAIVFGRSSVAPWHEEGIFEIRLLGKEVTHPMI